MLLHRAYELCYSVFVARPSLHRNTVPMPSSSVISALPPALPTANTPLVSIRAGMLLRVPKKLARSARHDGKKNAVGVWSEPGGADVWLEVKHGGLLRVSKGARRVDGVTWRRVGSPGGDVDGYAKEDALRWLDLVVEVDAVEPEKPSQPQRRPPALLEWAYVGVKAPQTDKTLGRCIHIEYEHLPDADHLGLGTFRMLDGRCRRAWLIHAEYTNRYEDGND